MSSAFKNSYTDEILNSTSCSSDATISSFHDSVRISQQLEMKVDMVYSLLAMIDMQDNADMGDTLLSLSSNPDTCLAMRQSGCMTLLTQVVYSEKEFETKQKAVKAMFNLVDANPDDKMRRKEIRILKFLEQILEFTNQTSNEFQSKEHPCEIVANLMKLSFDEEYRHIICRLGGIHSIAHLIEFDHQIHESCNNREDCIILMRYCVMTLTNLTFGDSENKLLLCSMRPFMKILLRQLNSTNEDLKQVTTSLLRNLSWKADDNSKHLLQELGSVKLLLKVAMESKRESTLKSALSALWNLSSHSVENKIEICTTDGVLEFLVTLLNYKSQSKTLTVLENSGGVFRNISSHLSSREDYRQVLHRLKCLNILVDQLASASLTVVSNACGSLWNLSARSVEDQHYLCDIGAITMLETLSDSKHKIISTCSKATLKILRNSRPRSNLIPELESMSNTLTSEPLPTLNQRKNKFQKQDLTLNSSHNNNSLESDVDQPTDYSLQFSEKDDEVSVSSKKVGANVVDQFEHEEETAVYELPTIYNTEDTPQTFSSAASLTDLRLISVDDKNDKKSNQIVNQLQSDNVSGICTPDERPVTFCEEGTPAELSRIASSFTLSIEDNDVNDMSDYNNVLQSLGMDISNKREEKEVVEFKDEFCNEMTTNLLGGESIISKCISLGIHKNRYSQITAEVNTNSGMSKDYKKPSLSNNHAFKNEDDCMDQKNDLINKCIHLGISKNKYNQSQNKSVDSNENKVASDRLRNSRKICSSGDNNDIDNDDGDISKKIEACINLGMNQNRYQKQLSNTDKNVIDNQLKLAPDSFKEKNDKIDALNDTNPPSIIDYISLNSIDDTDKTKRKQTLSYGLMAKRALNPKLVDSQSNVGSNFSLNLDNIGPPSIMNEANEVMDMQNSLYNVDSITSEVADRNLYCNNNMISSINCIENIEPPSMLMDHVVCDEENSYIDIKRLNPKERRQLEKDRFKTYIISSHKKSDDNNVPFSNNCNSSLEKSQINIWNEENRINYSHNTNNYDYDNCYCDGDGDNSNILAVSKARIIKEDFSTKPKENNQKTVRGRRKLLYNSTTATERLHDYDKMAPNYNLHNDDLITKIPVSAKVKSKLNSVNCQIIKSASTDSSVQADKLEIRNCMSANAMIGHVVNGKSQIKMITNVQSKSNKEVDVNDIELKISKKKKQITSKIAGLWKKVEHVSKNDSCNKKSGSSENRIWLGKNENPAIIQSPASKPSINHFIPVSNSRLSSFIQTNSNNSYNYGPVL